MYVLTLQTTHGKFFNVYILIDEDMITLLIYISVCVGVDSSYTVTAVNYCFLIFIELKDSYKGHVSWSVCIKFDVGFLASPIQILSLYGNR